MDWRGRSKRFGIRFIICFAVLGAVYLGSFGLRRAASGKPSTPPQKIAALRAALDQSYVTGSGIAQFRENDAVSASMLGSLMAEFQSDITGLQAALTTASPEISPAERTQLKAVINRQTQAKNDFTARFNVLSLVITYDPSSDLANLDIAQTASTLAERAAAAQNGLKQAANNPAATAVSSSSLSVQSDTTPAPLVTKATQQALLTEAACFGQITAQLNAQQAGQAAQTRSSCVKNYPQLRWQAIQNAIQLAFGSDYQTYVKNTVLPLLKRLNTYH